MAAGSALDICEHVVVERLDYEGVKVFPVGLKQVNAKDLAKGLSQFIKLKNVIAHLLLGILYHYLF